MTTMQYPLPATEHTDLVALFSAFAEAYVGRFAERAAAALDAAAAGDFRTGRALLVEEAALSHALNELVDRIGGPEGRAYTDGTGDMLAALLPAVMDLDAAMDDDPEEAQRIEAALRRLLTEAGKR